jgi:hypothetical protein
MFVSKKTEQFMKKIMVFPLFIWLVLVPQRLVCEEPCAQDPRFGATFSSGYVFKHDDQAFRETYGFGMGNVITADWSYNPWESWGFGAKMSYWLALGKTTFFQKNTFLQEIPVTFYIRPTLNLKCCLQLYASLGGGFVWIKEKSYLGHVTQYKGIGEVETGFNYPVSRRINVTSAFRYLFPRKSHDGSKIDVGGFDLRAGIGVVF